MVRNARIVIHAANVVLLNNLHIVAHLKFIITKLHWEDIVFHEVLLTYLLYEVLGVKKPLLVV